MPIAPCFDPTTGASGGAAPGGSTPPGLTVTGRTDGEAYTVTAGARSLTISNPDGAALITTVELASDGSAVPVTDSATTSPSWTAPSGASGGDAVQVRVGATKDGLTTSISFTERMVSTGLSAITTEQVDLTDGTWTLEDPNNLVDTITIDGSGFHTITWNAFAGSADYNPGGGTNFTGPRWYKLAKASGVQVDAQDASVTALRIVLPEPVHPSSAYPQLNVWGTIVDPTASAVSTQRGLGIAHGQANGATTYQVGAFSLATDVLYSNANTDSVFGWAAKGKEEVGTCTFFAQRHDTGAVLENNTRTANQNTQTTSANLHVYFGAGILNNTHTMVAGTTSTPFQLHYAVLKFTDLLEP
jgi:hypothetical protein